MVKNKIKFFSFIRKTIKEFGIKTLNKITNIMKFKTGYKKKQKETNKYVTQSGTHKK